MASARSASARSAPHLPEPQGTEQSDVPGTRLCGVTTPPTKGCIYLSILQLSFFQARLSNRRLNWQLNYEYRIVGIIRNLGQILLLLLESQASFRSNSTFLLLGPHRFQIPVHSWKSGSLYVPKCSGQFAPAAFQ